MATNVWEGAALAVAQVNTITPASVGVGNTFTVTINGKSVTYTAAAATVADVVSGLLALLQASTIAEFTEVTWTANGTANIVGTAATAGVPFTQTSSASGGTATLTTATTTASAGPDDVSTAGNYSTTAIPVSTQDLYVGNTAALQYGLSALSGVTLNSLNILAAMTNDVGLPNVNASGGYWDYRQKYLQVGATTANIGQGAGGGSGRIKWDMGSVQSTVNVYATGQRAETGLPALLLIGSNVNNVLNAYAGDIGVAAEPGQAAQYSEIRVGYETSQQNDVALLVGAGCTLAQMDQSGGTVTLHCGLTTLNQWAGTTTLQGDALNLTTLNLYGGTFKFNSSGTISNLTVGPKGTLDASGDLRPKTVTNCTLESGATIIDPYKTITFTNPILLDQCGVEDVSLELGKNVHLART